MKRRSNRNLSSSVGRVFRTFRPHIAGQKHLLILGTVSILLATILDVLQPWPLKFIYDHIFLGKAGAHSAAWKFLQTGDSRLVLGILSLSFIGVSILGAVADYAATVLLSQAASNIITEVRDRLFLYLEKLPL